MGMILTVGDDAAPKRSASAFVLLFAAVTLYASGQFSTAQAQATPPAAEGVIPSFDVAGIHVHKPLPHERSHIVNTNDRFITVNEGLKAILEWAFDLPPSRIVGGPEWINSARFDIEAKAENALDTVPQNDASAAKLEKRRMVQALLASRFGLAFHKEDRELPIYALVISRSGPMFLASQPKGTTINAGNGKIQVEGGDNTVALLAEWLAEALGRVVIDKTGIQGSYSINLKWTPDDSVSPLDGSGRATLASDQTEPPLFTAIQEQLGLKLEPLKAAVPVLVIDHIEMPSEN